MRTEKIEMLPSCEVNDEVISVYDYDAADIQELLCIYYDRINKNADLTNKLIDIIEGSGGIEGPMGPMGPQGPQGIPGKDGANGATGATGPQGPKGDAGAVGPGITYKGLIDREDQLPQSATVGDCYIKRDNKDVYVWNGKQWDNVGNIKGVKGDVGPTGPAGAKGDKGEQGVQGPAGQQGVQGPPGPQGVAGVGVPNIVTSIDEGKALVVKNNKATWSDERELPNYSAADNQKVLTVADGRPIWKAPAGGGGPATYQLYTKYDQDDIKTFWGKYCINKYGTTEWVINKSNVHLGKQLKSTIITEQNFEKIKAQDTVLISNEVNMPDRTLGVITYIAIVSEGYNSGSIKVRLINTIGQTKI